MLEERTRSKFTKIQENKAIGPDLIFRPVQPEKFIDTFQWYFQYRYEKFRPERYEIDNY